MAARGGWRPRRFVLPHQIAIWVSGGRWGPRRLRVEECVTVISAEHTYDLLIRRGERFEPGWRALLALATEETTLPWTIEVEVLANAVWRKGQLFYRCPNCHGRVMRLYVPIAGQEPRCRRCWGLSYRSQSRSYKSVGFLSHLARLLAHEATEERRQQRRRASRERYAVRRTFLSPTTK